MLQPGFLLQLLASPELRSLEDDSVELTAGKPLALLAYLALEGRPVAREDLASLLWPEADRGHARASVRQALWTLRQILGQDAFPADDPLELAPNLVETDLDRFHKALEESDLDTARLLWAGPPLQDLEFPRARHWQRWIDGVRMREEERFGMALAARSRAEADRGLPHGAVRWLREALEVQPYQASHRLALVEALLEGHQLGEAGEALSEARQALGDTSDPGIEGALTELDDRLATLRFGGAETTETAALKTEFVGRATEFSRLSRQWRRAKTGHSQVGLILGPPGIGKTRLAQEISLLTEFEGAHVVSVKAVEVERTLEWGLASDLVKALHGLPGAAGVSNRSAAVLARLVPSLAGWKASLPFGGAGVPVEPAAITDALLDLVCAVADEAPVFLLVDDLQWVDRKSRAALSHLARAAGSDPVFLVLTCRTGEGDPEVAKVLDSLSRLPGTASAQLSPLAASEVSELLVLLLEPQDPAALHDLAHRVFGITHGNPLFIVEILKLLQAEGLMEPNGRGKWRIDDSCLSGPLPVPETVELAIQRQLDELGENARILAAQMAHHARPLLHEELRRLAGLDPFEMTEGVRQLFERDLIRRGPDTKLLFVHDAVESAARRHLRVREHRAGQASGFRGWFGPGWWKTRAGVASLAVLGVAAALALVAALGGDGARTRMAGWVPGLAPTYPYGQGRVWVQTPSDAYWVTPPARRGDSWATTPTEAPFPQDLLRGPVKTTDGTLHWFVDTADGPEDPPYVGIPRPDGTVLPVWKVDGDVGYEDLSPDGRYLLLMQEHLGSEHYTQDLITLDLHAGTPRTLLEPADMLNGADWSPDGQKIAVVARGKTDTLYVLDPSGSVLKAFAFPGAEDLNAPSWCQDSDLLALAARRNGMVSLGLVRTSTGEAWFASTPVLGLRWPLCLGLGSAVLAQGAVNGALHPVVFNLDWNRLGELEGDSVLALPEITTPVPTRYAWVPDTPEPVVQALEAEAEALDVMLGEAFLVSAQGRFTDGGTRPVEVTWASDDPSRISVDSGGLAVANRPGPATLVATFAGWIQDSVQVTVLDSESPDLLFSDDFSGHAMERWDTVGYPAAEIAYVDREPVLSLTGDGRYQDGVVAREFFELRAGGTVEMDFRLPVTRTDRQRIQLCVEPAGGPPPDLNAELKGSPAPGALCMTYPAGENVKFDDRGGGLTFLSIGHTELFRLPESMDPSDWTRLALQIRPDGQVSLFVDRKQAYVATARLGGLADGLWRVRIAGKSVDTEAYVREVMVWRGMQYGG